MRLHLLNIVALAALSLTVSVFAEESERYYTPGTHPQEIDDQIGSTTFYMHRWRDADDTVDGWDWSLPPGIEADPSSGIKMSEKKVGPHFPGRICRGVDWSWRKLEPEEGRFDFEPLRQQILAASDAGRYALELHIRASVWELHNFPDEADYPSGWKHHMEESASAPRWLEPYDIPLIEMKKHGLDNIGTPFQVVNMDIYHPDYHQRYVRMVEALGESGILAMPEVSYIYVHILSSSRGEEGFGPESDDPNRKIFEERLKAWADACPGNERKLCLVSNVDRDLASAIRLGMGQRNGFVEMYMMHCRNAMLGQSVDDNGYLVVDESNPIIAQNRASGDENEEYVPAVHVSRFGPVEAWPHRYRESMLRVLQMRRNEIWGEGGPWLMDPPLLGYVALELGRSYDNAPDAWCYLRESYLRDTWKKTDPPLTVKNFERWLYQRDSEGFRSAAVDQVDAPRQNAYHADHRYDMTARRTDRQSGNTRIGLTLDDRFLTGGPHRVAIKVTYRNRNDARWALVYQTPNGEGHRTVQCGNSDKLRTATFFLDDACFPVSHETVLGNSDKEASNANASMQYDFRIEAEEGDATISFIRVVKL